MRLLVRQFSVILPLYILLTCLFPFIGVCQEGVDSESSKEDGGGIQDLIDDLSRQGLKKAEKVIEHTEDVVGGRTIIVGLNWGHANLAFFRDQPLSDGTLVKAALTDNGRFNFIFQYETPETFLFEIPMLVGKLGIGYNLIYGLTYFETDQQQVDNVFKGEDLGSRSKGYYLNASPLLFIKLGPLTEESEMFWKFGVGLGGSVMSFDANVIYQGETVSEKENISHQFDSLNLFTILIAEIHINNWAILYRAEVIYEGKYQSGIFNFSYYFLGLVYRIKF